MGSSNVEFVGAPCGHHGSYTFYKAFKYSRNGKAHILCFGEFFFVKITSGSPLCLGELQLLWGDKNHPGLCLSSVRLYFLPEHAPEGRQEYHGKDELLATNEKVVLQLDDLVKWIVPQDVADWKEGSPAVRVGDETTNGGEAEDILRHFAANNYNAGLSFKDVHKEKLSTGAESGNHANVLILSYARYCRYRAVAKRLQHCPDSLLKTVLISAIGGLSVTKPNVQIMFCRDTCYHPDVDDHEFRQDHLAPNMKGRPRKKRSNNVDKKDSASCSGSSDTEDFHASSSKLPLLGPRKYSVDGHPQRARKGSWKARYMKSKNESTPILTPDGKQKLEPEEEVFLKKLHKYMRERCTPIERLPTLGFKEVDLYRFFTYAQRMGGYDQYTIDDPSDYRDVTQKRMWKHIYDKLGGHHGNTSAATCTRRQYEKLLLPFERHERGEDDKPMMKLYNKPRKTTAVLLAERSRMTGNRKACRLQEEKNWEANKRQHPSLKKIKGNPDLLEKERKWEELRKQRILEKAQIPGVRPTTPKDSTALESNRPKEAKAAVRVPATARQHKPINNLNKRDIPDVLDLTNEESPDVRMPASKSSVVHNRTVPMPEKTVLAHNLKPVKAGQQQPQARPLLPAHLIKTENMPFLGNTQYMGSHLPKSHFDSQTLQPFVVQSGPYNPMWVSPSGHLVNTSNASAAPTERHSANHRPSVIQHTQPAAVSHADSVSMATSFIPTALYGLHQLVNHPRPKSPVNQKRNYPFSANPVPKTERPVSSSGGGPPAKVPRVAGESRLQHANSKGPHLKTGRSPGFVPGGKDLPHIQRPHGVTLNCSDQPTDLSMKTMRKVEPPTAAIRASPSTTARTNQPSSQDEPINLTTKPRSKDVSSVRATSHSKTTDHRTSSPFVRNGSHPDVRCHLPQLPKANSNGPANQSHLHPAFPQLQLLSPPLVPGQTPPQAHQHILQNLQGRMAANNLLPMVQSGPNLNMYAHQFGIPVTHIYPGMYSSQSATTSAEK